jgi:hypothetical protein
MSDIMIKGQQVNVEGGRKLKTASGKDMIKIVRQQSDLSSKINELLEADKQAKAEADEDDVLQETVLLLKDTLPDLFMRDLAEEKELRELFDEFCATYSWEECPVLRVQKQPHFQHLPTRHAITILDPKKTEYACNLWKSLLGYLGIKKLPFPSTLAEEMVMAGLKVPPLRDELLMMFVKEATPHPDDITHRLDETAEDDVWGLMYISLIAFSPSDALYPYLLSHFLQLSFKDYTHEREVYWPRLCLRMMVQNEITSREVSEFKSKLAKDARDAIVNKRICSETGQEWYITQREIELYAKRGKPVPTQCPEARTNPVPKKGRR